MGVTRAAATAANLLEVSRLLMVLAAGLPLRVTLAYPAAAGRRPRHPDLAIGAGRWRGGFPRRPGDWAAAFAALAVAKHVRPGGPLGAT